MLVSAGSHEFHLLLKIIRGYMGLEGTIWEKMEKMVKHSPCLVFYDYPVLPSWEDMYGEWKMEKREEKEIAKREGTWKRKRKKRRG